MSLILDALKRAERERRSDPMPGVEVPGISRPRRPRRWGRIAGIALLVVIVLVLGVSLLRGKRTGRPIPAPIPKTNPAARPPQVVQARPAPPPEPATPAPTVIPGTESVSSLDELSEPEAAPPPLIAAPAPQRGGAPASTPAPAAAGASTTAPPAAAPEPAPAEKTATAEATPREVPQALTQPAPLRKFREMPPEFRADFPPLNVQVHVYERETAQRFVIVNDRRYREGEQLAEGPRLLEIVREGMVLEFRGEKFLYALNR